MPRPEDAAGADIDAALVAAGWAEPVGLPRAMVSDGPCQVAPAGGRRREVPTPASPLIALDALWTHCASSELYTSRPMTVDARQILETLGIHDDASRES